MIPSTTEGASKPVIAPVLVPISPVIDVLPVFETAPVVVNSVKFAAAPKSGADCPKHGLNKQKSIPAKRLLKVLSFAFAEFSES